jgi:hypothetical protein
MTSSARVSRMPRALYGAEFGWLTTGLITMGTAKKSNTGP